MIAASCRACLVGTTQELIEHKINKMSLEKGAIKNLNIFPRNVSLRMIYPFKCI